MNLEELKDSGEKVALLKTKLDADNRASRSTYISFILLDQGRI